ncbi:glycosyl hydrolase family 18 protein [Clostridium sp.]|uniref:glycosyl hydrolase family 18 protein n=1 Tax=Clostridium sp. TaxID=1506 RepID=UPI002852902D|nr:glycosyl hydrolase family 18 protein [Clostridium sp.]
MKKALKKIPSFFTMLLLVFSMLPVPFASAASLPGGKLLVGYWHNFDNGTGIINLRNVSSKWDVIDVSFGETGGDRSTIIFTPCYGTEASFKADIDYLHSLGKKVVLSIGGQNGVLLLPDAASTQNFINSAEALIDKYGFDGLDMDLESGMSLNSGDNDFKKPTTPQMVNLISSLHTIAAKYGSNFILSMAPETAYVQGGMTSYGNIWGAYLPVIYGTRDILTYIHVQHYNAGGNSGLDGVYYNQGTADYEVAMADMLLHGFPIAGNTNNMFPALREDQVMIGLPACPSAAPSGGYINPTEMKKALDYIIKGIPYGGKYKLSNPNGYPGFKGLMAWSINWDAQSNFEFSTNYRAYFDGLTPPVSQLQAATLSASAVNNGAYTLTATVPVNNTAISYQVMEGTTQVATGTLVAGQATTQTVTYNVTGKAAGTYNYTVVMNDATNSATSNQVSVTVPTVAANLPGKPTLAQDNWNGSSTYKIIMNMWWGENGTSWKLYENGVLVSTKTLTANGQNAQTDSVSFTGKANGTYVYKAELINDAGSTFSDNYTYTVTN